MYLARHRMGFHTFSFRLCSQRHQLRCNKMKTLVCRVLILFTCVQVGVVSWPDGAGACGGNAAAVKGLHLDTLGGTRKVTTGSLQTGGLSLVVNGAVVPNGGTVTVEAEALNALFVMGMSDYRGILMRLESLTTGVDASTFLTPLGGGTANAEACAALNKKEIVGVTHKDGDLKNRLASVLNVSQNNLGMYNLDITVVVKNSDTSVYYHTQYKVNVIKTTKPPTKAPKVMMGMGTYFLSNILFASFWQVELTGIYWLCSLSTANRYDGHDGELNPEPRFNETTQIEPTSGIRYHLHH
jgi:hypothetical protein